MPREKGKPTKDFTYSDYLAWPEDQRWEVIDGAPFDMTPGPETAHQEVSSNLHGILWAFFEGKPCRVFSAPFDVRLPKRGETEDKASSVVQPDVMVVCDPAKIDVKGILGAPDFIIEVLSLSTASKDHIIKRALYERHGVKEYWLVHPLDRIVTVYRLVAKGRFGPAQILDGEGLKLEISHFPGLLVDFSRVFPPKPKVVREAPRGYFSGQDQDQDQNQDHP